MAVMQKTYQHSSLVNRNIGRMRHLLIQELDGAAFTDLIAFEAGGEVALFSGTLYDVEQAAVKFGQSFVDEGFEWVVKDKLAFEPLEHAVKLAMRLGHDAIYDRRLVQMNPGLPNFNATGETPLKGWPGMQAKNGGSYSYAITLMHLVAAPQLPPNYPLPTSLSVAQQFVEIHKELEKVGPRVEFLFAGITLAP